jgi:putative FmdB family regulatory protein
MPTYEYVCKRCGHLFEIIQSMRDDPLTECPECGGELRKVFAPPAISFKGSGFYTTDHRKKSKRSTEGPSEKKPETEKKAAEGGDPAPAPRTGDGAPARAAEPTTTKEGASGRA